MKPDDKCWCGRPMREHVNGAPCSRWIAPSAYKPIPRSQARRDAVMDPAATAHRIFELEADLTCREQEIAMLRDLIGKLYEQRGEDRPVLYREIKRAFREASALEGKRND